MEEEYIVGNGTRVQVSIFDYSVESHFKALDTISNLCEEPPSDGLDESDIQRLSSLVTFLREWRYFNYGPRIIRFANEIGIHREKDVLSEITLSQFSSAAVPKKVQEGLCTDATSLQSGKDFVMYAGGSVWALDWCPRVHERSDCHVKCEFIAVSSHPPESHYHKLGAPLTGRGVIQIWCMLNVGVNEEEPPSPKKYLKRKSQKFDASKDKTKRPRGRPRKMAIDEALDNDATKNELTQSKRPRGRPRKKPRDEFSDNLDGIDQFAQPLSVQPPEDSSNSLTIQEVSGSTLRKLVTSTERASSSHLSPKTPAHRRRLKPLFVQHPEYCSKSLTIQEVSPDTLRKLQTSTKKASSSNSSLETAMQSGRLKPLAVQHPEDSSKFLTIQEVTGIAHRKLQTSTERASPSNSSLKTNVQSRRWKSKARVEKHSDDICQPLLNQKEDGPPIVNHQIDHSSEQDSTVLNSGDGLSKTSLVSCSIPKDIALPRVVLCLAHNGKVAWDVKWKPFNEKDCKCKQRLGYLAVLLGSGSLEVWEVPLLRTMKAIYLSSMKEGTDPRFVKLEPVFRCSMLKCGGIQSIPLTVEWSTSPPHDYLLAGCHDGTVALWKFVASGSSKDSRPLLCFSADTLPIRAVSWAPGERCVILSFDDGAMRIISLVKAAYDVPATGKPFVGTKQQGLHLLNCSSFAIWSVQVSRITGMVAYCSADGTIHHFQLTNKAVEKDHSKNRPVHFLCGSMTEDDSAITVNTPLDDTPVPLKKTVHDAGERSMRSFLTESNSIKSPNKGKNVLSSVDQPLALCYGNEPYRQSDDDITLAALKNKQRKPKSSSSSKKKAEDNQALVCRDEEATDIQGKENEKGDAGNGIEVLPPKAVALHQVRWNMNKGSERWLCYGGAAGIIRCQAIRMPDVDKKTGKKIRKSS